MCSAGAKNLLDLSIQQEHLGAGVKGGALDRRGDLAPTEVDSRIIHTRDRSVDKLSTIT